MPVVLHLHGAEFHLFYERECGILARRVVRWVFRRASRVVVLSVWWRDWVRQQVPGASVEVIHNPVPLRIVDGSAGGSVSRGGSAVLFLGRIGPRKGAYDLLEAAARLAPSIPALELWLGGDGDTDEASRRALALGIGNRVVLLGWVIGEQKALRLGQAAVFVLPSYNEGLPMSVLEAMAAGLPVVATPVGGIPDAVTDGVEGFLVPPGDVALLAERLRQLLSNPALRASMGAAAREKVRTTFATEVIVPRVEALYRKLTSPARP